MSSFIATARRGHAGICWLAIVLFFLTAVFAILMAVDHRTLLGAPLWLKPLKFAFSFGLYSITLAWLMGRLPAPPLRRTGWFIIWAVAYEMLGITGQAARGIESHFNGDSTFDTVVYYLMGAATVVLWVATAFVLIRLIREPGTDPVTAFAARSSVAVSLVGMATGYIMTTRGGHAVDVPEGGPGMPLTGWSTTGGDLRIGHFVGLHALQLLPLLAALLVTYLDARTGKRVLAVVSAAYLAVIVLLTWQAFRGQPLLSPDIITLVAFAVVLFGTAAALAVVFGRRSITPQPQALRAEDTSKV